MAVKFLDNTGLGYFWSKIKAWCNATFAAITHNHASNAVNAMTGYSKPSTGSALATTDTLNEALGKLEAKVDAYDDSNYVHKTGNETINGIKTFNGLLHIGSNDGEAYGLIIRNPNTDLSQTSIPNINHYWTIAFCDATGSEWTSAADHGRIGLLESGFHSNNTVYTRIAAYKRITGEDSIHTAEIVVGKDANDIDYATCPPTSENRNYGLDIVTRDWIPKDTRIIHTTGNENISGVKTFNDYIQLVSGQTSIDGTSNVHLTGIMANNDFWRISAGGTADDQGFLEIATYDNGNEPIYFKQVNSGGNSERVLTLLNSSGNSRFPGSLYLPRIYIETTVDAKGTNDSGCGIHIGNIEETHLLIDNNEILAKASPTTVGNLYLNVELGADGSVGHVFTERYISMRNHGVEINKTTVQSDTRLRFLDKNDHELGGVFVRTFADKSQQIILRVYSFTSTNYSSTWADLMVGFDANGNAVTYAPTPATSDNSSKIATTAFVKAQNYVTVNGVQTINDTKTFTSIIYRSVSAFDRNTTLSNNTNVESWLMYALNSSSSNEIGGLFVGRGKWDNLAVNYTSARVRSANGKWADVRICLNDNNVAWCEIAKHADVTGDYFKGNFFGKLYNYAASGSYADIAQVFRNGTNDYRVGVLRLTYDSSTKNTVLLGVCSTSNGAPGGLMLVYENTARISYMQNDFRPSSDNVYYLGGSSYRWKQLYAATTTIATSDARYKDFIANPSEDILAVWDHIEWKQFKFKDAIEEKGSSKARVHTGLIAQDIKSIFETHNIDVNKYAFFCYDEWDTIEPTLDEEGNEAIQGFEAGDRYSLRYEEALCIEAAYQRRKNKILENRISELERQVSNMLQILQSLKGAN